MLTIKNLSKTYADGTAALKGINLSLPTGMVGLLGPNGAGKSTLLRTLACIQSPDTGSIVFNGTNTLELPSALRDQLGYLPQYFGVYPNMSCFALLEYFAVLKGMTDKSSTRAQINELLELTNLKEVAKKKVTNFSGGMRQRFGIAQALLGNPNLIIMDEPTAGLDPAERDRLHDLLVTISKNKLVLLSTHIVEDIENLCHHVALINSGQIIEHGTVQSLITPLEGKVWLTNSSPGDKANILSKRYQYGRPYFRVHSDLAPDSTAKALAPTLQDRYFLELASKSVVEGEARHV
ncbi:ABC transporter ATP-binding protein [Alteromonas sp. KUL49]|uniref:ABC transporter ATP-binding protein n=1 Tax=Alteromonas sp. KUL49 TaxID=2480798 RepID=UPI00102EDE67|nr:ABC transporter ATP-binding protein [Alteromonas sp. KUL49]TAP38014.1 ABC transporter ATP-binding protein [Alteromonas sp. KUL49]GEA12887.1 multidrug ABC transporter ATP-binding protein [Alteromonas sp. KUL49]